MEEEGHPREQEQHERMLRGMKVFRLGSRLIRAGSYFQQEALLRSLLIGGNFHCYPKKLSGNLRHTPNPDHCPPPPPFRGRGCPSVLTGAQDADLLDQVPLSFPFADEDPRAQGPAQVAQLVSEGVALLQSPDPRSLVCAGWVGGLAQCCLHMAFLAATSHF